MVNGCFPEDLDDDDEDENVDNTGNGNDDENIDSIYCSPMTSPISPPSYLMSPNFHPDYIDGSITNILSPLPTAPVIQELGSSILPSGTLQQYSCVEQRRSWYEFVGDANQYNRCAASGVSNSSSSSFDH